MVFLTSFCSTPSLRAGWVLSLLFRLQKIKNRASWRRDVLHQEIFAGSFSRFDCGPSTSEGGIDGLQVGLFRLHLYLGI